MFMHHDGERTQTVRCERGKTTPVPDWVKDDIGYKNGLKDKSILDLTPPKATAVAAVEEEPAVVESPVQADDGDDDKVESKVEAPKKSPVPRGLQGGSTVVKTK